MAFSLDVEGHYLPALDKRAQAGYRSRKPAPEKPMALVHAQPLDVISLRPLSAQSDPTKTHSLLKTDKLQLMRLVLAAGQSVPEHQVAGEITIQCLEGEVLLSTPRRACALTAGELVALPAGEPHSLLAKSYASLLVTILLHQ